MVRKCIVENCKSADNKILCHRFPSKDELAFKWLAELGFDTSKYSKNDLKKYVVCTLHFDKKDYKNELSNGLNLTALPKLHGHESRVNLTKEHIIVTPYEFSILQNMNDAKNQNRQGCFSCTSEEIECKSEIPFGIDGLPEFHDTITRKSLGNIMDTSITECTESEFSRIDEFPDSDSLKTDNHLLEDEELKMQLYESDIEIIEYSESIDNATLLNNDIEIERVQVELPRYERSNLSETVSLISSIAEADEEDFCYEFEKTFADAACQSEPIEILLKEYMEDSEDEEFKNKSRKNLIELIKEQKKKIVEVDKKLREFQATHIKLVQSMDAFKMLLNVKDVETNS